MGKITELLTEMLRRQINDRGIVVWYDPTQTYEAFARQWQIPGVDLVRYEDGFFRLREQLEPYLEYVTEDGNLKENADQPPSLVVYVPLARAESEYALIEAETAGVVMEPGAVWPECNTRLGGLVEKVFEKIAPAKAAHLARQADEGLLTVEELDRMAEDAGSSATGALQVIFENASVEEIVLRFAASDAKDTSILEKNALGEMAALLHEELGWEETSCDSPVALRATLRQHLLVSELVSHIPEAEMPESISRMKFPGNPMQRDLVGHVCQVWRNRQDFKDSYIEAAKAVEQSGGWARIQLPLDHLKQAETFPSLERRWLATAASHVLAGNPAQALDIARTRLPLFWPREIPACQMEWRVIEAAAEVCQEANRIQEALKKSKWTLDELIKTYACHQEPWMRLDQAARRLESRYARLEPLDSGSETLEKALVLARQRYADVLHALASMYATAIKTADFGSREFTQQTDVFKQAVRPLVGKKIKTAYFLVDALRYEMAAEMMEGLGEEYECHIQPILGQLPGITPAGMAALLPGADQGMSLEKKSSGLCVRICDHAVTTRKDRAAWLRERAGTEMVVYRLGEVVKLTPKKKKDIAAAGLVVVTSQEIDRLGEEAGDEEETRVYMDEVLEKLRRAVRSLARAGVQQFVITADHGYLLVEALDPGLAMDAPGGDTVALHPRVWIGQGGVSGEGYLRFKGSDLELGGALEFAFPRGLGTFRVAGGTGSYFHGGLSLQEQVLPLLTIKARPGAAVVASGLKINISMSKEKITNRLFTVSVNAEVDGLFPETEKRVRLDVLSGKEEVGFAVAAGYDFEEGSREIKIKPGKPNVVTLMLQAAEIPKTVTVQVLDCESQLVLDTLKDIPVELTI